MEIFNTIAFIFLAAWFVVNFTPIHGILNLIIVKAKGDATQFALTLIQSILSCQKCSALWIGLIITGGDLYISLIASFISMIWDKLQSRIL